jgi:hypothetical protein
LTFKEVNAALINGQSTVLNFDIFLHISFKKKKTLFDSKQRLTTLYDKNEYDIIQ